MRLREPRRSPDGSDVQTGPPYGCAPRALMPAHAVPRVAGAHAMLGASRLAPSPGCRARPAPPKCRSRTRRRSSARPASRRTSPSRARGEAVARAEVGIAGVLPNPSVSAGTSTQTAKLSLGVSVPLVVLGQRGAAIEAGRAELATTRVETEVA